MVNSENAGRVSEVAQELRRRWPWIPRATAERLAGVALQATPNVAGAWSASDALSVATEIQREMLANAGRRLDLSGDSHSRALRSARQGATARLALQERYTAEEIARALGTSRKTVIRRLREYGVRTSPRRPRKGSRVSATFNSLITSWPEFEKLVLIP
jgi:hypothetical protein